MDIKIINNIINNLIIPNSDKKLYDIKPNCIYNNKLNRLTINVSIPIDMFATDLKQSIFLSLGKKIPLENIQLNKNIITYKVKQGINTLPGVKNVIVIGSGKGGVGKSTITSCLAIAMNKLGAKVGVLDADIYGPSQPLMFNLKGKKPLQQNQKFIPLTTVTGIQINSIGFLIDENQAIIWRGPLANQALQQLFFLTNWDVDYLFVDLPPGTGDIQLTLAQKIPITGAVIITTPQDVALLDVKKSIAMFQKVDIPIIGIIENMSTYICNNCGFEENIFGTGGGEALAQEMKIALLSQLPLSLKIRQAMDFGSPEILFADKILYDIYIKIAWNISLYLSSLSKDYSSVFSKFGIKKE